MIVAVRDPDGVVRARCLITGRVQGVFFRYATAEEAKARNISGWVRNLDDGRVEAAFEGPRAAVEELIAWCGQGPPMARVDAVDISWEEPAGEREFSVRG